jgi:hypothetical protein
LLLVIKKKNMNRPTPKHKAPKLGFPLDGRHTTRRTKPENFTLLAFYRGLHCPLCKKYLIELEDLLGDFDKRREGSCCEVWTMRNAHVYLERTGIESMWVTILTLKQLKIGDIH